MADELPPRGKRKKRGDETAELTLGDLTPVEPDDESDGPPTEELEVLDVVSSPPPTPGMGRPRRDASPHTQTIAAGVSASELLGDEPARSAPPPPPAPRRKKSAKKKTAKKKTKKKKSLPPPAPRPNAPEVSTAPGLGPPSPQPQASAPRPSDPPRPAPALETPERPDAPAHDASATELRDHCLAELERASTPERKARLAYELGRLHEVELDDDTKAAEHYQTALRTMPDHAAAIRGARRVLRTLGRHGALPALFDAEVQTTRDPAARAQLLYAKARVMEEHLRQTGPALAVYRDALAHDPGNLAVLKAIERAQRRDKQWGPLAETYGALANAVEDAAMKAAWTAVRARITETHLGDPVQAAALYEAALDADPHATAALANVKRLSAAQRRWPQLVAALRREHELVSDGETKRQILGSIAQIQERRIGDVEAAVETLEAALADAPESADLLTEIARLHRQTGRAAAEAAALSRLVELSGDDSDRAARSFRIGHLYEQSLEDLDRAAPWFERTLEAEPGHRGAALALARIHERRGEWDALVGVLSTRAGALQPRERAELEHRIGEIVETKIGRPDDAAKRHAQALSLDPRHRGAFRALSRLHTAAQRWAELAELYERAIDAAPHSEDAIQWLFRLGALLEDRLDDPAGALAAYGRILDQHAEHRGALAAAQRAAERADEPNRLIELLDAEAALTRDAEHKDSLALRAARVVADRVGDEALAIRRLEGILRRSPKHRESLDTLAELLSHAGKWAELVSVYERLLPLSGGEADKVRLHHRLGEIHKVQLGDATAAIKSHRAALRLDPSFSPAREALWSALEADAAWEPLAKELEQELSRTSGTPRARIATELGGLREERLEDRDGALEAYEAAIEAAPRYRRAIDARDRLLTDAKQWGPLTEALDAEAAAGGDTFLETQSALRAALVKSEEQGAVGPALEAFRPVFAADPDHLGALLAVEEIYSRTRDDEGLADTYEKMARVVHDPKAKLAALQELARSKAATGSETTAVQRRVLSLHPDDPAALEALASAAEASGERATELAMQARLASTADDARVGAFHQTRVGEILLAEGDATGALGAFRAALGLDSQCLAAARGLTRAARAAEDTEALRQASRHEAEVVQDRGVAVSVLLEAARLRHAQDDEPGAAEDYERALELDPESTDAAKGLAATQIGRGEMQRLTEVLTRAAHAATTPRRRAELHLSVSRLAAHGASKSGGDQGAAIAAAERALSALPNHPPALAQLADALERDGQWERAVAALELLLPKAKDEALIDAHLRMARMAEARLSDPDRATRSLRAVLARDEDNEEALWRLVRLERTKGHDEEALRLAKKLIAQVQDPDRKAATFAELAELERRRDQPAAAAAAAFSAIGLAGPTSPAAPLYRDLVAAAPEHATWDNYSTALMTYLDRAKSIEADRAPTYRELARVFGEAHNRPDRAIATLREGVQACPEDASISLALVSALTKLEAHDKALDELRRLLAQDVSDAEGWRAMADVLRTTGEADGAAVALAPLVALGTASAQERRLVEGREARTGAAPHGILGRAGLQQLTHEGVVDNSAAGLVHALSDVFAKLEGFDPEEWGVTKKDRLRPGEHHPMRVFADRLCPIFGVPEFDLYMVDAHGLDRAVILPGGPPALLVARAIEQAPDAVLAYHLARPLALLSLHLSPLDIVPDEELTRMLVAAARQYEPGFTLGEESAELEEETKRVAKAIGFFSRGKVQDAATTFAATPPEDVAAWASSIREMARRAALLVCDDLEAALSAHGAALGEDAAADDLALFWAADPAIRFRRAVSQLPP